MVISQVLNKTEKKLQPHEEVNSWPPVRAPASITASHGHREAARAREEHALTHIMCALCIVALYMCTVLGEYPDSTRVLKYYGSRHKDE